MHGQQSDCMHIAPWHYFHHSTSLAKSEYDTGATLTQQPSDSTITRPHDFYFSTFIEGEYNQKINKTQRKRKKEKKKKKKPGGK